MFSLMMFSVTIRRKQNTRFIIVGLKSHAHFINKNTVYESDYHSKSSKYF